MLYIMAVLFGLGDAIGTVTPPLVTAAVFGTKKYGDAFKKICRKIDFLRNLNNINAGAKAPAFVLFYCNGFCKITWFIYIKSLGNAYIVAHKL